MATFLSDLVISGKNQVGSAKPNDEPAFDRSPRSKVFEVVKRALPECAVAMAINVASLAFFATPISVSALTVAMTTSLGLSCLFAAFDLQKSTDAQLKMTTSLSRVSIVNTVGMSWPNLIVHELGHVFAANALFIGANPKFWIKPFQGGSTIYTASNRLTKLGYLLGKQRAMLAVAVAGLAASAIFATVELTISYTTRNSHPSFSQYTRLHARSLLFHETIYGLTAFLASKKDLSHDLVRLWKLGGINPLIPVVALIAIPLIELAVR